jgi:hypothetical protein
MYRYRSPEKLIEDIIFLNKKYGAKNFWFTDSLINGSIKNYKRLVDTLNELIDKGELSGIRYGGYFRTHKKMGEEFFDKARKSGLVYMNIGVENGVAKTLGLMEKRQTPEIIKNYLNAVTKDDQITFDAGWIPGFPRETNVDFVSSLKFLFDVKHNFKPGIGRSGRINVMKGTDVLVETPLATQKDVFGISKDESLLKNWISNDYKNNIFSRHTRAHLTDYFLKLFNINRRGLVMDIEEWQNQNSDDWKNSKMPKPQSWALDKTSHTFKSDGVKDNVTDDKIYNTSWLTPINGDETFQETLENSIIDQVRGFCWVLHNLHKNIDLSFDVEDNFKVFNLKDTRYNFKFIFKTNEKSDFELDLKFKIHIDDEDKPFIDVKGVDDLNVDRVYKVKGNFEKSYSIQNNEVKDLYLDSINYEKYRISLPRTAVTGQW